MPNLTNSLSQIKSEMRAKILAASEKHGGVVALSIKLGMHRSYITKTLSEESVGAMIKLCDRIDGYKGE